MSEYKLSDQTLKTLALSKAIHLNDTSTVSKAQIQEFNNRSFRKNLTFYRLYRPAKLGITVTRYIIPVGGGDSVSGLMIKRTKAKITDPASIILYLHDGGWVKGNMDITEAICTNIARITGAIVIAVDYRLAPEFKFPIPAEDCYSAFLWVHNGARYWKADSNQVFLMGSGAGANLAIATARMLRDRKAPTPAGLILLDPITDCRLRTESFTKYADLQILNGKELNFYVSNYQREPKDILNPLMSPLVAKDNSRLPQTLIFASELSPLFDDAKLFSKALKEAEVPVNLIVNEGQYVYSIDYPGEELWREKMNSIADFVRGMHVSAVKVLTLKERIIAEKSRVVLIQ